MFPISTVSGPLFSVPVVWQSIEMQNNNADPCKLWERAYWLQSRIDRLGRRKVKHGWMPLSPGTTERSQFWPVRLDTDHFILHFLLDNPFAPVLRLTFFYVALLHMLLHPSFLLRQILRYFYYVKYTEVRKISLHLLKNTFSPLLTNVYFSSWVLMTSTISNYPSHLNGTVYFKVSSSKLQRGLL